MNDYVKETPFPQNPSGSKKEIIISEVKHKNLNEKDKAIISRNIEKKFYQSKLANTFKLKKIEVLDPSDILNLI